MESKVKRIAGELLIFHIVHQKYECTWMRCRFMLHLFVFYNCWTQSLFKKKARGLYLSRQDRKLWRIKELWVCFVSVCVWGGVGVCSTTKTTKNLRLKLASISTQVHTLPRKKTHNSCLHNPPAFLPPPPSDLSHILGAAGSGGGVEDKGLLKISMFTL